jgi:predicted PhzF superfamily epimerase YddE/YHI9
MYLVDAFAHAPFTGNPAAVCLLNDEPEESWMQSVAAEMNQAETAFVWPQNGQFELRWFTPTVEVDLCGHATLASAHVLYEEGHLSTGTEARFQTKSGILACKRAGNRIEMDFPVEVPAACALPDGGAGQMLSHAVWTGKNRMDWFVELPSEKDVLGFQPEFALIESMGMRGLIVTARADRQGADFVSRFFAPQSGIPEDNVTGSAHCALAPYWAAALSRNPLTGYQASRRGGFVYTEERGDRVVLGGRARTVVAGAFKS